MKFYSLAHSGEKGFTLIEMVVSIALFTVVAVVAIGALLKVLDANKKSQSLKTTINNINFALESMTREMRVGTKYYCMSSNNPDAVPSVIVSAQGCNAGTSPWIIAFETPKQAPTQSGGVCNLIHAYWFDTVGLKKWEQTECGAAAGNGVFFPVINGVRGAAGSDDISIKLESSTAKVTAGAGIQSYAQFRFRGHAGERERTRSAFDFQTTVSQRLPD